MSTDEKKGLIATINRWDHDAMNRVPSPTGLLKYLALGITAFGSAVFTLPAEILGWFFAGPMLSPWFGLSLLADVPGHLIVIVPFRYAFKRERPTPFTKAPLGFDQWNIWSFPSAHSLRTWTLATIWSFGVPSYWYVFVLIASIITGTRIVLRRHFPSDIIVGSLLGIILGYAVANIFPTGISCPWI